jgi:hypothetical protein
MANRVTLEQLVNRADMISRLTGKKFTINAQNNCYGFSEVMESGGEREIVGGLKPLALNEHLTTFMNGMKVGQQMEINHMLPVPIASQSGQTKMVSPTLRVFAATVLISVDPTQFADEEEQKELTIESLKKYLSDAVVISLNDEDHGNVGVGGLEFHSSTLRELDAERLLSLYGH